MKRKIVTRVLLTLVLTLVFNVVVYAQCTIASVAGSLSFSGYSFTTCPTITVTGYINDTDWGTIKTFLNSNESSFLKGKKLDLSGAVYTGSATGNTSVTSTSANLFGGVCSSASSSQATTGTVVIPDNITTLSANFAYNTRVNVVGNNVTMVGQAFGYIGINDTNYTLDLASMFPNLQYVTSSSAFAASSTVKSIVFPASFIFNDANYTTRLNNSIDGTSGTNSDNVTSVSSITILNTLAPVSGNSFDITALLTRFQASTNTVTTIYVPTAQLAAYQALYPSSTYPKITFGPSTYTDVKDVESAKLSIRVVNRIIYVDNVDSYEVYDINGKKEQNLQPLSIGVYIVKSGNIVSKVFVK